MNDDELLQKLGAELNIPVPEPSASRIAAVREAALRARDETTPLTADVGRWSTRRALLMTAAAAAVGAIGGAVVANARADEPTTSAGPPTELLSFSQSDTVISGATVSGSTINHTWGVELLLDAAGFPVGTRYDVNYVDRAGVVFSAGGFVGSERAIHCRCNGVLLRDEIDAIEIRDPSDQLVSRATFV